MRKRTKNNLNERINAKIQHFQKRCMERVGYIFHQRYLKDIKGSSICKFISSEHGKVYYKLTTPNTKNTYIVVYDSSYDLFVTIMYYNEWMQSNNPELTFQISHEEYVKTNKG